nr:transformation/transcription domain-associated protein-like isoform X2 [Tanacetum cinerariifolium]
MPFRVSPLQKEPTAEENIDLGVKIKTQLMADKSVFKIIIVTIIAASAEPDSIDPKDDYVTNVCRHFAIIIHMENSSTNTPISAIFLGGPLLSSNTSNSFKSKNGSSSNLIELDPLIFLDALVEVLADEDRLHVIKYKQQFQVEVLACCRIWVYSLDCH